MAGIDSYIQSMFTGESADSIAQQQVVKQAAKQQVKAQAKIQSVAQQVPYQNMTQTEIINMILDLEGIPASNRAEAVARLRWKDPNLLRAHLDKLITAQNIVPQGQKPRAQVQKPKASRKSSKSRRSVKGPSKALVSRVNKLSRAIKSGRIAARRGIKSPEDYKGNLTRAERFSRFAKLYKKVRTSRRLSRA